ncbi:DUF4118 domain-containing protein [Actinoallomurus acaciae]|uniref:histidine kinase n=1 Tax=Actinoallomurus acaciae TaxID=502577 RepID=A0ABV5YWC1_9ACTN
MRPSPPAMPARRSRLLPGILVAAVCLTVETLIGIGLSRFVPVQSLGVLYLVGLVLVTSLWGLGLGLVMAVASTVVFDYFLVPPRWTLWLGKGQDTVILAVFMALALLACALVRAARMLSSETEAHQEADLSADLARLVLRAADLSAALPATARRLASALCLPSASIETGDAPADVTRLTFPLRGDDVHVTLRVPAGLSRPVVRRLRERIVPSLEVLLEAASEREKAAGALRHSRDELARIAEEQAALRRLATLVAHAAPEGEVFHAVACEMGRLLPTRHVLVIRYETADTAITVGNWGVSRREIEATMPLGDRWPLEKGTVAELVARTRAPARVDHYDGDGEVATRLRSLGVRSAVGCPIIVGRALWGLLIASSSTAERLPDDTEVRMVEFTELAAAAIANAQSNADLKASRARVVAAADEARRRIERDLHDSTQQRLIAIGLEMRGAEASIPPDLHDLRLQVAHTAKALEETVTELQELSRGLHPAILAKGGLESALKILARRSSVPVALDVTIDERLPERSAVTAYYVVSEALTNAAKHAHATVVHVTLTVEDKVLHLSIRDDGVGGAAPTRGSGLIGLTDRVEAAGGTITVSSPKGVGTTLLVEIPVE